jgi:hypothetical protein
MKDSYDLDELALSMVENGYFEAEPMVAIPKDIEFFDKESESFDKFRENEDSKNRNFVHFLAILGSAYLVVNFHCLLL